MDTPTCLLDRCDHHPNKKRRLDLDMDTLQRAVEQFRDSYNIAELQKMSAQLLETVKSCGEAIVQAEAGLRTSLGDQIFNKHSWACFHVLQFLEPLQIMALSRLNRTINALSYDPRLYRKRITLSPDRNCRWYLQFGCGCEHRLLAVHKRRRTLLSRFVSKFMIKDVGNFDRSQHNFFGQALVGKFPNVEVLHLRHNFTHYDPLASLTDAERQNLAQVCTSVKKICLSYETLEDLSTSQPTFPAVETMVLFLPDDVIPRNINFSHFPKVKHLLVDAIVDNVSQLDLSFPLPETLTDLVLQVQTSGNSPTNSGFQFNLNTTSAHLKSFTSFIYDNSSIHVTTQYTPPIKKVFPNADKISICPDSGHMDFKRCLQDTPYSFAFLYLEDHS